MSFISKQLRKDLAKKLDDLLDFKVILGGILGTAAEALDGNLFAMIIVSVDDKYGKKIPEMYREAVVSLIEAFVYNEHEKLTENVASIIDELVDLPWINDDVEADFIFNQVKVLKSLAIHLAKKK